MADSAAPRAAIVLVNWNGWRDTISCVRSLLAAGLDDAVVLVCDNASADGSLDRIEAWAKGELEVEVDPASPIALDARARPASVARLTREECDAGGGGDARLLLVDTGGNLGFAGGNNVGLRWAMARRAPYSWLLNNDTVVEPAALPTLLADAERHPGAGLWGSILLEYDRPDTIQAVAGATHRATLRGRHIGEGRPAAEAEALAASLNRDGASRSELVYPVGASFLVSLNFLERIGLMEERYFLYYEETDWVLRGAPTFRPRIVAGSRVHHLLGASAGSSSEGASARSMAFMYRSRLLVARRFLPGRMGRVVLGILEEAARGLARGRRAKAVAAARALTGRVAVPR